MTFDIRWLNKPNAQFYFTETLNRGRMISLQLTQITIKNFKLFNMIIYIYVFEFLYSSDGSL